MEINTSYPIDQIFRETNVCSTDVILSYNLFKNLTMRAKFEDLFKNNDVKNIHSRVILTILRMVFIISNFIYYNFVLLKNPGPKFTQKHG